MKEIWLGKINNPTNKNRKVKKRNESLEILHARAVEYRHTLNCAVIAREEPLEQMETLQYGKQDREILARRKRFKDVLADQFSDFHWSLGWIRRDPVTRIREISLTTVANRLFSIPELFSHYQAVMLKSKIKRKHIRPIS